MIAIYADVVFGYCDGWVPVRALAEKGAGDGPPHVPFIEADATLAAKLALQATWASDAGMALFVAPGTVAAPGDARADSIVQTQVVLVDLDHGDIGAKRDHLVQHLGPPDARGRVRRCHRRGPAQAAPLLASDRARRRRGHRHVCRARHMIAAKVGGDPSFRSAHQPIRVAGSSTPNRVCGGWCEILNHDPRDHDLGELLEAIIAMPPLEGETGSTSTWPPPSAAA
jgi:putative DNA primase/helicase